MYDEIARELAEREFPVRYAATAGSFELRMFQDLLGVCRRHHGAQHVAPAEGVVEIDEDGLHIGYDPRRPSWVRIRIEHNEERVLLVADPNIADVVWIHASEMDWISFVGMMLLPRAPV